MNGLFHRLLARPDDAPPPWETISTTAWWQALAACPQDPIHHAEGDVATHTRMVCDALQGSPEWQGLAGTERGILLLAALLHDIAKPETTRKETDGRITARGHSGRGEVMTRRLLWEAGIPFHIREQVTALIRFHQHPFWLIEREVNDARRIALGISHSATRCDHLAILAEADARGRICADKENLLVNIALFREFCREQGCLTEPYPFSSDHSRFLYFRTEGRDPAYRAHDDTACDAYVLSGLPGAGKDTYIHENLSDLPVISLDALRSSMGISPTDNQEPVLTAAREQARGLLRRGESFAWNATNLSREIRAKPISLAADYRARVHIVYREASAERLMRQNRNREAAVPEAAMERLFRRWENPDKTEAHTVTISGAE